MNYKNRDIYQTIYTDQKTVNGARSNKRLKMIDWSLFKDRSVLDIGCNNGMLAIQAANSGASIVIGVEKSKAALMAREIIKESKLSNIIIYQSDIEDKYLLSNITENIGRFNIIFFCAMLNHMKDKVKMLRWIDSHCNGHLIYETNFEFKPEKYLNEIQKYTSFVKPKFLGKSGDRKPEDYNLYMFSRNNHERYGKYDTTPPEYIDMSLLKITVDDVNKFKGDKYIAERKKVDLLKKNIELNDLVEPIWVKRKGPYLYIQEGGHRYLACKELGYKNIKARVIA